MKTEPTGLSLASPLNECHTLILIVAYAATKVAPALTGGDKSLRESPNERPVQPNRGLELLCGLCSLQVRTALVKSAGKNGKLHCPRPLVQLRNFMSGLRTN